MRERDLLEMIRHVDKFGAKLSKETTISLIMGIIRAEKIISTLEDSSILERHTKECYSNGVSCGCGYDGIWNGIYAYREVRQ